MLQREMSFVYLTRNNLLPKWVSQDQEKAISLVSIECFQRVVQVRPHETSGWGLPIDNMAWEHDDCCL